MSDVQEPQLLQVPVDGGELTVGRWGSGERVIVAPHGITANHTSWAYIAEELADDFTIYAPDLRGRGGSASMPGPYGMERHADDCIAILDHVGVKTAVMAGHSMGGFVTVKAAVKYPDRLDAAILIDGGLPLVVPDGITSDQLIAAVIGPAMERLSMTFESLDRYLDFWRQHPSFQGDDWTPLAQYYFTYDIHEVDGSWRSKVDGDVIRADGSDSVDNATSDADFASITVPMTFVWAPRGIMNADPLYPLEVVKEVESQLPNFDVVPLDDVSHYTLAMRREGAGQVAAAIRDAKGVR